MLFSSSEYSAKYRPELDFVLKDISLTNMSAHNLLEISMVRYIFIKFHERRLAFVVELALENRQ